MPTKLKKRDNDIKPKSIRLSKVCPPNTKVGKSPSTGEIQMTTVIEGTKYGWAACGLCHMHITMCQCRGGVVHPPSIEWIFIRRMMHKHQTDHANDPRIISDHPEVRRFAWYWYVPRRERTGNSLHDLIGKSVAATKPLRQRSEFPKSKPLKKRLPKAQTPILDVPAVSKKPAKRIDDIDKKKVDEQAAVKADSDMDKLMAKLERVKKETKPLKKRK